MSETSKSSLQSRCTNAANAPSIAIPSNAETGAFGSCAKGDPQNTCCAQLQSELAQVKLELEQARAKIASIPEDAIDNTEFNRRVELLIARCKREAYGRIICPLCEKLKLTPGKMRVHLQTAHREILIAPKATFE